MSPSQEELALTDTLGLTQQLLQPWAAHPLLKTYEIGKEP